MFRKLLRDAVRGANPKASLEQFAPKNCGGGYCSGNVFDFPLGRTKPRKKLHCADYLPEKWLKLLPRQTI